MGDYSKQTMGKPFISSICELWQCIHTILILQQRRPLTKSYNFISYFIVFFDESCRDFVKNKTICNMIKLKDR